MTDKVTATGDLENLKKGEVIELPPFGATDTFFARVKRPSLMVLCKVGTIPNELLGTAQKIFEGEKHGDMVKYGEVLNLVAEAALVEPEYKDVKDILTDEQLTAIFNYTQLGVRALKPFRELREKAEKLAQISNSRKGKQPEAI